MKNKRIGYAIAGVIVMLFAGLIYAWSVLAGPIGAYFTQWSKTQLSFTFTLCMMLFCLGGLFGGMLSKKTTPGNLLRLSAILFLAGFAISGQANSLVVLYIGYGILAGLASGFAYNAIMSSITKWFPDSPGLISGVLLMGFGFGSFLIGKVYQAVTPSQAGDETWRRSFLIFGIILCVILVICSFLVKRPTQQQIEELMGSNQKSKSAQAGTDKTTAQMLRTSSFWIFFIWAIMLSAAGLAIVSQATGVAAEVGTSVSASTITTVVGLISIFNGVGRVIFGGMYDKMGRKKTMLMNDGLFFAAILVLVAAIQTGSFPVLVCGFILMGLAYGGVTPTNSAFVNDYYGSTHYAVNLPMINMNLLIASFGGTIAGNLYDRSGSYLSTLIAMIIAVAVGTGCTFLIREKSQSGWF